MKNLLPAIRITIFMTLVLGLVYPLAMTLIAKSFFPQTAAGDLIDREGQVIGSRWIGQKFERAEYFWSRPSGIDYNPLASGGSNLGQASADLKKAVDDRRAKLIAADPTAGEPPQDLLFASGSGLDPHVSPAAALYQVNRVARARNLEVDRVRNLVDHYVEGRQFGFFGEPTVNVLALNLALDQSQGRGTAPGSPEDSGTK